MMHLDAIECLTINKVEMKTQGKTNHEQGMKKNQANQNNQVIMHKVEIKNQELKQQILN